MDLKMVQNRAPEAPKTLLEPGCRSKLFRDPFWAHFGTPQTSENRALAVARCYFCKNGMTRPGAQNRAQNDPNIEPQTTPRTLQMTKKIAPVWSNFSSNFDDFGGSQMTPKSTLKYISASMGRLEASRAPFGGHLGSMLASF